IFKSVSTSFRSGTTGESSVAGTAGIVIVVSIINPQETQQVAARDEKWVPSAKRVKISSTNIRLETIVPQKEETFQVVIDIIKNSTCFKAFTISIDSKGKGLKGKKIVDDSRETVDVSEESEPEPKPLKKKTSSKIRLNKKLLTLSKLFKKVESLGEDNLVLEAQMKGDKDDENDDAEKDDNDGDADDEGDDHVSDTQDADDEDVETKSYEEEIYKYKIRMHTNKDEKMKESKVVEFEKGEEEITDVANTIAEKNKVEKDDPKKAELPLTSSNFSISLGFSDQFLKLSSDSSLISTVKDTASADYSAATRIFGGVTILSLPLVTPIILTLQQTTTLIPTPPITIDTPIITIAVYNSNALIDVQLRVAKLEQDVSELKKVDHSSEVLVVLESHVLAVFDSYMDSKVKDVFQMELQKHTTYLIHKYSLQHLPKITKKLILTVDLEKESEKEYDFKSDLYQSMNANKSFNRNPANHRLYHALMEALIKDGNAMDNGVADTGKQAKSRRTKGLESLKKPSNNNKTLKGKDPSKGSKTGKSASAKEPVKEPITEVIMVDADDDVVCDDDQLQAAFEPMTTKTLNLKLFKQPPRPPSEWNKCHRIIATESFFKNDLEYLKTFDPKVNKRSKYNVYSTKAILGMKNVKVVKLHRYGYMEEIMVKRSDQQLYAFKEDYPIWQVIQNGNGHISVTTDTNGMIKVLPPKTAKEVMAREREIKARTTLLMALREDHLAKFQKMADAKEMWEAIKSKFGGNDESYKMQKYLLKQQFKGFYVSSSEGLHKGYDRSLPSSWSQVALIMRTKPGLDTLNFDDLYNNLKVFQRDVKGTTASSSSTSQNRAFVSADNTRSTNNVSTAYSASSPSVSKSQKEGSASYTNEVIHSFFANQSSAPQLDYDDLEQKNDDDLEEMDLKWQVAMISVRIKKFHKRTGRKLQFDTRDTVGFDKTKVECFNCHKIGHFASDCRAKWNQDSRRRDGGYNGNKARDNSRGPASKDDLKALVTIDREVVDWSGHVKEDTQNFDMMAYSSSNSECDLENTPVNNRYAKRMHTVPPPMIGNYMPSGADVEIDYSKFTYGPKQTSADESDSKSVEDVSSDFDSSVDPSIFMLEPVVNESKVVNKPKAVSEPKVWTDAPIIEEYESHSDDDLVSNVQENIEKPSFAFTDSVKHVKTPRENVKETVTPNHYPKIEMQDRHSHSRKGLGYARKSCFVCGSFSHLIRDCDFHEKRMEKQDALIKSNEKGTGQQAHRPVWNNVQRVNHQNQFVSSAVLTKTHKIPVNAARQHFSKQAALTSTASKDYPHKTLKDKGIVDSRCSRHMTGNKAHLADYQEFKGGFVAFGCSNGRITGKRKIKAGRLDFEDVYYMEELKHYNLFSVSQMCNKKNKVLFTDINCLVLSPDFKLPDENQDLLKIPRQSNMYSFNLKNIDHSGDLSCLFSKALIDESNKWYRRLGHVNFKNLNKLVKGNLVRGLPSKIFENDHTCVVCQKRKQHKASRKAKTVEAVNTACYVLNRVLVTKPQNKTPYELLTSRQPIISYLRPFGCLVTILNTIDQLGKFDGKSDSGFSVGYSLNNKAFRVYNLETKRVEENLHVTFLENKPNVAKKRHAWMFALDYLKNSMNYEPVSLENQANKSASLKEANHSACTEANDDQDANSEEINLHDEHFVLPVWSAYSNPFKSSGDKIGKNEKPVSEVEQILQEEPEKLKRQEKEANDAARKEANHETQDVNTNNTNLLNVVEAVNTACYVLNRVLVTKPQNKTPYELLTGRQPIISYLRPFGCHVTILNTIDQLGKFDGKSDSANDAARKEANHETQDVNTNNTNLLNVVSLPVSVVGHSRTLNDNESSYPNDPLMPPLEEIYASPNLPFGKKAIETEWVYRTKKDERGVVVINKVRLVAQGHRQEDGIYSDEVFALVARIDAIRIVLAFASYMGFIVYQMDVKSAFLYDTIDEEVYVTQPLGFVDPKFPNKVYKDVKALYRLH
nr:ribonuclease H-like domain-containing protein [Tanacetum cinerariifolium]